MVHSASLRAVLLGGTLLAAAFPAHSINDMFAKDAPVSRMTKEDFEIAGTVMRKAMDEGKDGQAFPWKNPKTSASGTVTPLDTSERNGMKCRGAAFDLSAQGKASSSRWTLCKTPSGWKVAEGR